MESGDRLYESEYRLSTFQRNPERELRVVLRRPPRGPVPRLYVELVNFPPGRKEWKGQVVGIAPWEAAEIAGVLLDYAHGFYDHIFLSQQPEPTPPPSRRVIEAGRKLVSCVEPYGTHKEFNIHKKGR